MFNHANSDYICPICLGINTIEDERTLIRQTDVILKNEKVFVFVSSFGIGRNLGHIVISPVDHIENVFSMTDELLSEIIKTAKQSALALKQSYACEGITIVQNNEPAGDQHAFHYHLHVFPRYEKDQLFLNMRDKQILDPTMRAEYANKLKVSF